MKKKPPLCYLETSKDGKPGLDLTHYNEQLTLGNVSRPVRVMEVTPWVFWLLVTLVVTDTLFNLIFAYFLFSVSLR